MDQLQKDTAQLRFDYGPTTENYIAGQELRNFG